MSSATYLYCVVRAPGPLSLAGAPGGLPRCGPVRALDVGDGLWLIASDAPLPDYGGEEIERRLQDLSWVSERALAHEAIIEHFSRTGTAVPLKLFTLFSSDERALAHIREERERLERVLRHIEGCVEWGVRIHFDESSAREVLAAEARTGGDGTGTGFLLRKKMEKDASRTLTARLRSGADAAFDELSRPASGAVRRDPAGPDGERLLLDAAFLVRQAHAAEFEATVERCAARLRPQGCELTLTGPWPPYNFVREEP